MLSDEVLETVPSVGYARIQPVDNASTVAMGPIRNTCRRRKSSASEDVWRAVETTAIDCRSRSDHIEYSVGWYSYSLAAGLQVEANANIPLAA